MTGPLTDIDVVILAGGLGTRSKFPIPKILIPIQGTPLLGVLLGWLESLGARRVILSLGYKADHVVKYLGENDFPRLRIIRIFQTESMRLGTASAVRHVQKSIRSNISLVINGDTLIDADMTEFVTAQKRDCSPILLLCTDENVSTGACLITRAALGRIVTFPNKSLSLEDDLFPMLDCRRLLTNCRFLDIGTPGEFAFVDDFLKGIDHDDYLKNAF